MAINLPDNTWVGTILTLSGTKKVVYSTVTGEQVGEIRNGKFVQTANDIPKPAAKKPRTVTVPETARAGGAEVALANAERDSDYYKSIAEDVDSSTADRNDAINKFNNIQKEIARLQGEVEKTTGAIKSAAKSDTKAKAREQFNKNKADYQALEKKYNLLLDKNSSEATSLQGKMFKLVNESLPLYKEFTGSTLDVDSITNVLAGGVPSARPSTAMGAPTGATSYAAPAAAPTPGTGPTGPASPTGMTETKPSKTKTPTKSVIAEGVTSGKPTPKPKDGKMTQEEIFKKAQDLYGNIDLIFQTNPELQKLLRKAIENKYEESRFLSELENTTWFKTNAGPIRQRGFYKRQYDQLMNDIKMDDPNYQSRIEELDRTSDYGRGIVNTVEDVTAEWTRQFGTPKAEDLITIRSIADNLYQYANEGDLTKIRNAVLNSPRTTTAGGIAGGLVGQNLQTLRSIASANGLNLDRDFASSIQTWMDRLAKGESIETIKSIIRNTAKSAWGVNDRVAGLLDQGVDLATIYAPYKERMSRILEIAPETISFTDLASKGVVGGKEEKNLYDFERELRKDSRWQYTRNAAEDVSNSALQVLKDFGFQG